MAIPHDQYCQERIEESLQKGKPDFAKAWETWLERHSAERHKEVEQHARRDDRNGAR